MHNQQWTPLPLSIALAGFFVGAGIYLGARELGGNASLINRTPAASAIVTPTADETTVKVSTVNAQDHIRGNIRAKAILVEYSDLECPFCKQFHKTIQTVMTKFNQNDVAWVYRHFPLDSLHSKARKEAEASECAAGLGGNDGFWKFTDRLFEVTPANNGLEASELPNIAEYIGLNRSAFETCLASGKYAAKVEAQYQTGISAGVKGTPYSVIVTAKGNTAVNGAAGADQLEKMLREALAK